MNLDTHYYAAPLRRFRVNEILTCEATGTYLQETAAFSLRSRCAFASDVSRIEVRRYCCVDAMMWGRGERFIVVKSAALKESCSSFTLLRTSRGRCSESVPI